MREIPSSPSVAVVSGDFENFSPDEIYGLWTRPEEIVKWWPVEATIDLREGGAFSYAWPDMGWVLTGTFTSLLPGRSIGFTWNWNHEPDKRQRQVDVYLQAIDAGTRMAVYHGEFGQDDSEVADRQGIIEGWIHFGMKLAGLKAGFDS